MGSAIVYYDLKTKQVLEIIKEEENFTTIRQVIEWIISKEVKRRIK